MRRTRFERGGDGEARVAVEATLHLDGGNPRAAYGERAGFVEHDVVRTRQRFDRVRPYGEYAPASQRPRCDGHRRRRGERQRAWTRDDEHGEHHRQHA